jgi:hypothetical protein
MYTCLTPECSQLQLVIIRQLTILGVAFHVRGKATPSTCPKRRRGGMSSSAGPSWPAGPLNMGNIINSFPLIVKFKYVLLKIP